LIALAVSFLAKSRRWGEVYLKVPPNAAWKSLLEAGFRK
jgi:hypothetical protein